MPTLSLDTRSDKPVALRRPAQLIAYSTDRDGVQHIGDTRSLKYFYYPDTALAGRPHLSSGLSQFVRREEGVAKHLDEMLRALAHYERTTNGGRRVKAEVVTYRGVMTRLLVLAQAAKTRFGDDDTVINATWFDGVLLLELDHAAEMRRKAREQAQRRDDADRLRADTMTFWGYKFEALATLPRPWTRCTREEIEARDKTVVDNIAEYCCLVRTGVGKTKMVLGAEVDGIYDYNPQETFLQQNYTQDKNTEELFGTDREAADILSHYVELKTSRVVTGQRGAATFLSKLLRTWAQCFLIGVPKVVYGFRDDDGYLKAVEEYNTDDLPRMVSDAAAARALPDDKKWNGNECISFYGAAVEWIKAAVPQVEGQVWRVQYRAGDSELQLVRVTDEAEERALADAMVEPTFREWRKSL